VFSSIRKDEVFGLDESIDLVAKIFQDHADIEYVLGFSQGAALLSALCEACVIPVDTKLVFVSGSGFFHSKEEQEKYAPLYANYKSTQHVIGEADTVVLPKFSDALYERFPDPHVLWHDGAHVVPRFKLAW